MTEKNNIYNLSKEEKSKLLANIRSKWERGKNNRREKEKSQLINYLSYKKSSSVFQFSENGELKEVSIAALKKLEQMQTNSIYPVVREMEAQIAANRPLFSANIVNYKISDFDARVQQAICIDLYEKMESNGLIDQLRIWYCTTGNYVLKLFFNKDMGKYVQLSTGQEVKIGEVDVDAVPMFDIVLDDAYANYTRSFWGIQRIPVQENVAKKLWPDYKFNATEIKLPNIIDYSTGNYYTIGTKVVIIYEYYEKFSDEWPEGLFVQTDFNDIIDIGMNPTEDQLPFIHSKAIEQNDLEGDTPISYARPQMQELNRREKQLGDDARKIGKPVMYKDRRSNLKAEMLGSEKVTVIETNISQGKVPGYLQPTDFSQSFYQHVGNLREKVDETTGIKPFQSVGTRTAGNSLAIQREASLMGNQLMITRFYRGIEQALNLGLDLVREKYIEERTIEYFDKEDYIYAKYIGTRLLKNIKIKMTAVYGLSDNKLIRQQQLNQMLALNAITLEKYKELLEFGELEKVFNSDMWNKMRASMENDDMTEHDHDAYVDIYENHLIHIEKHIGRLNKSDLYIMPGMKKSEVKKITEKRIRIYNHLEWHWYGVGKLMATNILQAGMILGFETMNKVRYGLMQMSMQQLQQKVQVIDAAIAAKTGDKSPAPANEIDVAKMAQGLSGIAPDTKSLQKMQEMMRNSVMTDMFGGMGYNTAPQSPVEGMPQ